MVLLLYCDSNLMTTLRLFDKWVSLPFSAQDPVVRSGQSTCVWAHCSTDVADFHKVFYQPTKVLRFDLKEHYLKGISFTEMPFIFKSLMCAVVQQDICVAVELMDTQRKVSDSYLDMWRTDLCVSIYRTHTNSQNELPSAVFSFTVCNLQLPAAGQLWTSKQELCFLSSPYQNIPNKDSYCLLAFAWG